MIHRAPLTPDERRECYRHLAEWMARRTRPHRLLTDDSPVAKVAPDIILDDVVAGRQQTRP